MDLSQSTRLLRHANFRRLFIGRVTSALGNSIAMLALTFGMLNTGASAATLGLVLAASTVPQVVLTLLGGVLGDRLERRRVLISTDVVQGVTQLLIGALFLSGHATVWSIVLLRLVYGSAAAFFSPAMNGAIVDVVGADAMQEARSFLSIGTSAAHLLGPAVGGIIVALLNPGWALVIDSTTFAVSAVALTRIHVPFRPVDMTNSLRSDFLHGWREFTSRTWAVKMIVAFMVYQATVLPAVFVLGPVHATKAWQGAWSWALLMTGMAVGNLLGGMLTLRWRPRRLLTAANLVWALDLPLILIIGLALRTAAPAIPAAVLFGMSMTVGTTLWYQALATHVPASSLARVTSYDEVGSLALNPLGYMVVGAVAAGVGAPTTFLFVIAGHVLMLAWLLMSRDVNAIMRTPIAAT